MIQTENLIITHVTGNIANQPVAKQSSSGRDYDCFVFVANKNADKGEGAEFEPVWYDTYCFVPPAQRKQFVEGASLKLSGHVKPITWFAPEDVNKEHPRVSLRYIVYKAEAVSTTPESVVG